MRRRVIPAAVIALLATVGAVSAQEPHTVAPETIEKGGQIFQSGCARCHGVAGDEVPGVNLASGRFMRVTTDDELAKLILTGIPGTGMPSNNLSAQDALNVVAYLRSLASGGQAVEIANAAVNMRAAALPGDADRGKALVEGKGQCLTCHSLGARGGRLGPDLSAVGLRRPADLQRSIVDPGTEVRPENRSVRVVTREGSSIDGRLLNHDSFTVQLLDSTERLRSFEKSDLQEFTIVKTSSMPSYRDKLSADEIADIVKYFTSLRGR